ncbi:MAG: transglutaminase family protein [Magnetococcales bacterium]|nr:transglutaminase family protein [Magnetococcales bacterium]
MRVRITHTTHYHYDRSVQLSPHWIRLCPANDVINGTDRYALTIQPDSHQLFWLLDAGGNRVARALFPESINALLLEVTMEKEINPSNPFNFLVDPAAQHFPWSYSPNQQVLLSPYRTVSPDTPLLNNWPNNLPRPDDGNDTITFITDLNQALADAITYHERIRPGVRNPSDTLTRSAGSCRDSAWLLVNLLRRAKLAARFVSGYLLHLEKQRPDKDKVDLHAWVEVYLPGPGWIGLDATSGLLTAQNHIPLARGAVPMTTSPVEGSTEPCHSELSHESRLERITA